MSSDRVDSNISGPLTSKLDPFLSALPLRCETPEEMRAAGRLLGQLLGAGDVVALSGDLGAGKTVFVRGLCTAFEINPATVTSPTFTIVNEYAIPDRHGITRPPTAVYHFDAYRTLSADEFFELGYEDYFFGSGVCVIEWPSMVDELLPSSAIRLRIEHDGEARVILTGS